MASPAVPANRYFRPRRLGHVNLWVEDLARSENFYNATCGLTVEFSEPDLVATFLGTGHTPHDLGMIQKTNGIDRYGRNGLLQLPGSIGRDIGLNHLAWELVNEADLVRAFKSLQHDAVPTDITVDHQVAHSVYMFDPDGNYNEFYCDTVRDWRKVLHGPMDLLTSHWDPLAAEGFSESRAETNPELRVVPQAPLHPRRITHAVLRSPDARRLEDFYTRIAGLKIVARHGDVIYLSAAMSEYSFNLVLLNGPSASYHHAAFELGSEAQLELSLKSLTAAATPVALEVDLPWKRSIFLRDPDGMLSEWYVKREGTFVPDRHPGVELAYAV